MARMLARSHRYGMGCGRSRRCCINSVMNKSHGRTEPRVRKAQRAHEKHALMRELKEN
jgi:hypothetical protein